MILDTKTLVVSLIPLIDHQVKKEYGFAYSANADGSVFFTSAANLYPAYVGSWYICHGTAVVIVDPSKAK